MSKLTSLTLLVCTTLPVFADDQSDYYSQQQSSSMQNLVLYFQNFGSYLGYDVTQNPTQNEQALSRQALIDITLVQLAQVSLFNTSLGSIPVNAFSSAFSFFVPGGATGASIINTFANTTFNSYDTPSSQTKVSVSPLIDQQTYQADPVSQSLLNILGTPDYTYCYTGTDATTWNPDCRYPLYDVNVPTKVIGPLPDSKTFFAYNYIQTFLSQLNGNALMAPLLYSTENPQQNSTSSSQGTNNQNAGLTAQNQAQQAANFIRYVSGSVTPIKLPKWKDYDTLYTQATASTRSSVTPIQKFEAQSTLSNYLASLRTFAAQSSVGLSNLYYILSKRLPQDMGNSSASNQQAMSQALSEFKLATWRIFDPSHSENNSMGNTQWINQINKASTATIQKEIAVLLSEINYQMYLDRQLQERILLTNSIMLLQNTRATQPNPAFNAIKE